MSTLGYSNSKLLSKSNKGVQNGTITHRSPQALTPATAEDLRMAGKIAPNPNETTNTDGAKAVQVKVPVVATVTQNIESDGKSSFIIEPPTVEHEQGELSSIARDIDCS